MNPWALLGGLLAYNYRRHVLGRDTLCSTARRHVARRRLIAALAVGFVVLVVHIWNGYND